MKTYTLQTRTDTLKFDAGTGRLISFRSAAAPEQEFIESSPDHPVCAIQWLDEQRQSRWMDSHSARRIRVRCGKFGKGQRLMIECIGLGGLDLDLVGTVTVSPDDPMSRWTAPDGRYAVALANWTALPQRVGVRDVRLDPGMLLYTATKGVKTEPARVRRHSVTVKLPPHSMVLVARAGEEDGVVKM